mgnify:CR=1 FL=1
MRVVRSPLFASHYILWTRVVGGQFFEGFYIGVVGRMSLHDTPKPHEACPNAPNSKKRGPVAQPSDFSGAGDWHTWIRKFKGLAELYQWDDTEKLIWMDCKLTGQAALTLETLDSDTRKDFEATVEALTHRFEPEAKRLVCQEKLWAYQRKKGEDWATVAENVKELATRAHPQSEDLASGFAMSRFLALLEEDSDLAIGVRRSGPKTLDEAVQEAIRLECINHAVHRRSVHVSAPVNLDMGLSPQVADLAKSIQTLAEGIAGLKASQEQNFAAMKNSLSEHENRLRQLESANNGRAPRRQGCFRCGRHGHLAKNCNTKLYDPMSSNHRSEYPCEICRGGLHVPYPVMEMVASLQFPVKALETVLFKDIWQTHLSAS